MNSDESLSGGRQYMPAYYFTYYPSDKIARFMSKEKPEYSLPTKSKFDLSKMDNPSEFLQRQFGVDEEDIKPFDRVKAAQNLIARQQRIVKAIEKRADELAEKYGFSRDDAEFQAEMEADIHKAAKKPEYWGLTWDELEPVYGKMKGTDRVNPEHIRYYITKDNIRFPPVQWESEKSGKIFEALAQYIPEGEGRERTRYNKLYFRDNDETIEGVKLNKYTLPTDADLDDFRKTYLDIEKGRLERAGVDVPYFGLDEEKARRKFADWLKEQERANAVETKDGTTLVPIKRVNAYSTGREDEYEAAVANKPRADRGERIKDDYANLRQPQAKRDAKRTAEEKGERYVKKPAAEATIEKAEEEAKAEAVREETRRKEEADAEREVEPKAQAKEKAKPKTGVDTSMEDYALRSNTKELDKRKEKIDKELNGLLDTYKEAFRKGADFFKKKGDTVKTAEQLAKEEASKKVYKDATDELKESLDKKEKKYGVEDKDTYKKLLDLAFLQFAKAKGDRNKIPEGDLDDIIYQATYDYGNILSNIKQIDTAKELKEKKRGK